MQIIGLRTTSLREEKKSIDKILNAFLFIFLKHVDLKRAYVFIYVIGL